MKGLCCAAQAAGDLGKPLVINVRHKDGTTSQRCGVCEVIPSCRDPQKLVFAFRFLKAIACGLAGAAKCGPTPTGIAQYNAARSVAATTGFAPFEGVALPIRPYTLPHGAPGPYALPPS